MSKQIDYLGLGLVARRNSDGSYSYQLQNMQAFISDPTASNVLEKGPWTIEGLNGLVYDGTKTLNEMLLEALQSAAAEAAISLYTDAALNRTTKEYRTGVDGNSFDPAQWLVNPDVSALQNVPTRYWKINGDDSVTEMDQSEKDVVDAAALPGNRIAKIVQMKKDVTAYIGSHYDPAQQVTVLSLWTEGLTKNWPNRIALVQSIMDWVNSVLTYFYGKVADMSGAATQSALDAITYDFGQFSASDPHVSLGQLQSTTN
jgi:hypothetical protein